MSRVSQGQRERMAVAQGIAARKIDETTKAHVSLNPFRNYSRQLARSWDYGYRWGMARTSSFDSLGGEKHDN